MRREVVVADDLRRHLRWRLPYRAIEPEPDAGVMQLLEPPGALFKDRVFPHLSGKRIQRHVAVDEGKTLSVLLDTKRSRCPVDPGHGHVHAVWDRSLVLEHSCRTGHTLVSARDGPQARPSARSVHACGPESCCLVPEDVHHPVQIACDGRLFGGAVVADRRS